MSASISFVLEPIIYNKRHVSLLLKVSTSSRLFEVREASDMPASLDMHNSRPGMIKKMAVPAKSYCNQDSHQTVRVEQAIKEETHDNDMCHMFWHPSSLTIDRRSQMNKNK